MENSEAGKERKVPTPKEAYEAYQALIEIYEVIPDLKRKVAGRNKPFDMYHYDGTQVRNWERDAEMAQELARGVSISDIAADRALTSSSANSAIKFHMSRAWSALDRRTKQEFESKHQFPSMPSVTSYVRFLNRTSQK